jgi:hypothetical protein
MTPAHFLLQTSDLQLRQVSRALLSGAPEWWRARFALAPTGLPPPAPLRTHLELPVFGIDVPAAVLDVFLEMIQVPELMDDYWRHAPTGLALRAWRGYMRAYGFTNSEDLDAEADAPPAKKARRTPFDAQLEVIAAALHAHIIANHPKGARFLQGLEKKLECVFVSSYRVVNADPVLAYTFTVDDAPLLPNGKLVVAHFLGRYLAKSHAVTIIHALKRLSPPGIEIDMETELDYTENVSKKMVVKKTFNGWPLRVATALSNDKHHVVVITFWYA